jgi:signal transduction histidine kinase
MPIPINLLKDLFPIINNKLVPELADGTITKREITEQFRHFFDFLLDALISGDYSIFNPLLNSWTNDLTQSDLEEKSLVTSAIINKIIEKINLSIFENLSVEDSSVLVKDLLPIYSYLINKSAKYESDKKLSYLQKELTKARSDLKKLDQSKSNFVSVAAHELKTPLTLIDGYTAMMIDTILKQEDHDLLVHTNGILNGSKRLRAIIDDMIDVSLIENQMLTLNFQAFWLNRLVEFVLLEISPVCKERRIDIDIDPFPGFSEVNFGDPERLIQLFRNLLTNAIKFTPDNGKINVTGRKLSGFVEVIISDTGIGIDLEDQLIIFDKFSRVGNVALHSSGKTKFKGGGPGLGLPIAKGIAEAHGGSIWVESPGYSETNFPGTTFHVLLPLREEIPEKSTDEGKKYDR